MKTPLKACLWICFALSLLACARHQEEAAKVVFTFDDHYIDSWWKSRELLKRYNIKASFYVTRPYSITAEEQFKLLDLINDGHEIGCHGFNHLNASDYLQHASADSYLKTEIIPAIRTFDSLKIRVKTFAYPFGKDNPQADSLLLHYFKGIRLATYKWENCSLDSVDRPFCKIGKNKIVNAIMIDKSILSMNDIEKAIIRAKQKKEVLVFLAHGIDSVDGLFVPSDYLKNVFVLCKKHQLESMTLSELWEQ